MRVIKDFNDFLSVIDGDTLEKIFHGANDYAKHAASVIANSESLPGTQVMAISYAIALALLGCYHEWLEQ